MNNGMRRQIHGGKEVSAMVKIMEIVAKETKGKSYRTYKCSYDTVGLPPIDYDDPNKIMKWKETVRLRICFAGTSPERKGNSETD